MTSASLGTRRGDEAVGEPAAAAASPVAALAARRMGLVAVTRSGADGVAYVSRLVERALADLAGERPWTLDLAPAREGAISPVERARFLFRLGRGQLTRDVRALIFSHAGLARAQRWVPASARVPYAVIVHGLEVTPEHMTPERMAALEGARLRMANSHFTARQLSARYPALGPVVPCPLALLPEDAAAAGAVDEALLWRVDPQLAVLILGRMSASERYKGHDQLIEAWPAIDAEVPGAQLVVAGSGDDAERLREKAGALGLGDRVLFCGRVSDATRDRLFERARAFAMPSSGEGFGLVYLEAMRRGVPCVASPEDGGADVVVDGETGLLAPQSDRRALVESVATLLRDPARARELGAAGRRRYERYFTYDSFRDRFAAVIESAFGTSATVSG